MDKTRINHDPLKLIRVGSSSIGEAIYFHENSKEHNPQSFSLETYKKIDQRKLGFKEEKLENKYADHGVKCEPMVLKIHEMITGKSLSEVTVSECYDSFFGSLSISKPDGVFIENETGSNFKIPVEVKTKYHSSDMVKKIPESHLCQVMFHIMCMDSVNDGRKTPFGEYLHIRFSQQDDSNSNSNNYSMKIQSKNDVLALRIMRNDKMIEEIRERLKILYYHYIFEDKIPDPTLFKDRSLSYPDIKELKSIYKNFDSVVNDLR